MTRAGPSRTTTTTQTPRSAACLSGGLKIIQDQAGHAFASTTGLYTAVSDDYRNRALARALRRYPELWDEPGEKGRP